MIAYFDSSSIVKWFFDEPFAGLSRETRDEADMVFTSLLSYPEVTSAINRAWKEGRCSKADKEVVWAEFLRVWPAFRWIRANEDLVLNTDKLIFMYGLRGYDAVQLASALLLKENSEEIELFFSCFDRNLNRAAKKEGLIIHNLFK